MKKTLYTLLGLCLSTLALAQFTPSGSSLYHIGGFVGIGTTTPTLAPLHILANQNLVQLRLERSGTATGISADIGGSNGNLTFYPGGYYNKNGNVYFNTTGKVGIGTEAPEDKLHIFSPGANGTRITSLLIDGYSQSTITDGSSQIIRFKGNADRYWGAIGGYTANNKEGMGIFAGTSTSLTTIPGFYLNSDQKVGIGTTSPITRLDIQSQYNVLDEFDAQIHLHTTNNAYGMFLGSHSVNYGVISQGSQYHVSYQFKARSSYSSGIIQHNGNLHFFSDSNLSMNQLFYPTTRMIVEANGNVGIGTTSPSDKLEVNGTIRSKKVKVEASGWPDYVFASDFKLRSLEELDTFIQANGHLPEVPTAKEVEENGLDLGDMEATLLKKVEELTLYLIEKYKQVESLKSENKELESRLTEIEEFIKTLKKK